MKIALLLFFSVILFNNSSFGGRISKDGIQAIEYMENKLTIEAQAGDFRDAKHIIIYGVFTSLPKKPIRPLIEAAIEIINDRHPNYYDQAEAVKYLGYSSTKSKKVINLLIDLWGVPGWSEIVEGALQDLASSHPEVVEPLLKQASEIGKPGYGYGKGKNYSLEAYRRYKARSLHEFLFASRDCNNLLRSM